MTWITTYSGAKVDMLNTRPQDIHQDDIAYSLARICRFNGHTNRFYSVAEHSVLMAEHLLKADVGAPSRKMLRTILLHDATEAYLGDLPAPVKKLLPDYKALEARLEEVIAHRFRLYYPLPELVKHLDSRILLDERSNLLTFTDHKWDVDKTNLEPLGVTINNWSSVVAEHHFRHLLLMNAAY